MGIVTPPRGSKGAAPILNGKGGGGLATGGVAQSLPRGSKGAPPLLNGGKAGSMPGYGGDGGPYAPQRQPQSTRSSGPALH